jgi:hypothetical protein
MSSKKQITANRSNGRKSRGPRTDAGTSMSSRSARKHGLVSISRHNPAFAPRIEAIANPICPGTRDSLLLEHAQIIGATTCVLGVRAEGMARMERLHNCMLRYAEHAPDFQHFGRTNPRSFASECQSAAVDSTRHNLDRDLAERTQSRRADRSLRYATAIERTPRRIGACLGHREACEEWRREQPDLFRYCKWPALAEGRFRHCRDLVMDNAIDRARLQDLAASFRLLQGLPVAPRWRCCYVVSGGTRRGHTRRR